ncbi:MAG: hypothetical protein WD876_00645 [Candidatus Pacearchaeota archaeon]
MKTLWQRLIESRMRIDKREQFEAELKEKYKNLSIEELGNIVKEFENYNLFYRITSPEKEWVSYDLATIILNERKKR